MKEFVVGFRFNERFNSLVATNFTLEGTGAAVIFGAYLFNSIPAMVAGLVLVVVGASALLMDLGNPINTWRSILKPKESWISRGALFLIGLLIVSLLYIAIPPIRVSQIGILIRSLGTLFSLLIMLYTGFLLKSMSAIPFWNRRVIPILFLSHSLTSGLFIVHGLFHLFKSDAPLNFTTLEILFVSINLLLIFIHLSSLPPQSQAAKESLNRVLKGELKTVFWGGGILLGVMVPLIVAAVSQFGFFDANTTIAWIWIAASARLIGDFFLRNTYLKSGVYDSLLY